MLSAFDAIPILPDLNSDLGLQLKILHSTQVNVPLDPSLTRIILADADESRIESRKQFYQQSIQDPRELRRRLRNVEDLRLNLGSGQQCVRDFFVCLTENRETWIDLYTFLNYNVQDRSICKTCGKLSMNEVREEIYTEINCPSDGADLSASVENYFNKGELVNYWCKQGCGSRTSAERRSALQDVKSTRFIIIILRRTGEDFRRRATVNTNNVSAIQNANLKDVNNYEATFEPICVVQHQGILRGDGRSSGHYTADVKNQSSNQWYRTSDNEVPQAINPASVTTRGYVFLYKNISN